MVFNKDNIDTLLSKEISDAMSFVFEDDTEVDFHSGELIRKGLKTESYSICGQFDTGEMYGSMSGKYIVKGGQVTVMELQLSFGDIEASSRIDLSTQESLLSSLTTAHRLYVDRKMNATRQHETIQSLCDKIDDLAKDLKNSEEFIKITKEIRDNLG